MTPTLRKGFTLIELLTVIAIIAILAGILFPVFARAREKAYTADCLSNVNQLTKAFMMYCNDWDQKYPSAGNYFGGNERGSDWVEIVTPGTAGAMSVEQGSLFPYVKNAEAYVCKNGNLSAEKYNGHTRTSYTMNSNLVGSNWTGIRSTHVQFPAQTFLLIEEQDENIGTSTGGYNDAVFYAPRNGAAYDIPAGGTHSSIGNTTERHGGGAIAGYCDGHAKWQTAQDLTPFIGGNPGPQLAYFFPRRPGPDQLP